MMFQYYQLKYQQIIQFFIPMGKQSKDRSIRVLENKYDQYEIQFAFNEIAAEVFNKKFKPLKRLFVIKCIIGILLTINVYVSHWYPLPWPKNYYLLVFCVLFYYAASYYFQSLDILKKNEGGFIGEYQIAQKVNRKYILKFELYNNIYTLCQLDYNTHKIIKQKEFAYNDYLEQDGTVLQADFKQFVNKFLA